MEPTTVTNSIFTTASEREARFETDLTARVRASLAERGLDDPAVFAERIGTIPSTARRLLAADRWSVDIALRVIEQLELPIDVEVRRSA